MGVIDFNHTNATKTAHTVTESNLEHTADFPKGNTLPSSRVAKSSRWSEFFPAPSLVQILKPEPQQLVRRNTLDKPHFSKNIPRLGREVQREYLLLDGQKSHHEALRSPILSPRSFKSVKTGWRRICKLPGEEHCGDFFFFLEVCEGGWGGACSLPLSHPEVWAPASAFPKQATTSSAVLGKGLTRWRNRCSEARWVSLGPRRLRRGN